MISSALATLRIHHHLHGASLGYAGIGAAAAASWAGVPGPGEPALIAGAIYALHGRLDLAEVLVVAWLGAMAGGVADWLVGRRFGHSLATAPGPLHRHRVQAVARGERFFRRFGVLAVYVAPSWVAGATGFPARRFLPANAFAAAFWAALVGGGAYLVGPSIGDVAADTGLVGLIVLGALALVGAVRLLQHHRPQP